MIFCLGDGQFETKGAGYQQNYCVFNKKIEKKEWEGIDSRLPIIKLPLTHWVDKKDMTDEEKEDNDVWKEIGGYLKLLSYEDAWKAWCKDAKESDKQLILNCPYFDAKIFTAITGLKDFATKSLSGKTVKVEIDGTSYEAIIK